MKFFSLLIVALLSSAATAADTTITLASTTSTQNSGLYDHLLPLFKVETGITVNVVAVGTGQAIKIAENGFVMMPHFNRKYLLIA